VAGIFHPHTDWLSTALAEVGDDGGDDDARVDESGVDDD
jgi:hypothetical protein